MKNILGNQENLEFYNKEGVKVYEFYTYSDSRNSYEYTHDKNGRILTSKDSTGYWSKCTRGEKGRTLTYENSDGCWYKYTRDEQGNELTYESSTGYWSIYTYDKNGRTLTGKTSDGYWNKYTRDEKGNELTYENSYGKKRGFNVPEFTMEELIKKLGDFKLIK